MDTIDVFVTIDAPTPSTQPTYTVPCKCGGRELHKHRVMAPDPGDITRQPVLSLDVVLPNEILVGRDLYGLPMPGEAE